MIDCSGGGKLVKTESVEAECPSCGRMVMTIATCIDGERAVEEHTRQFKKLSRQERKARQGGKGR